MSGRSPTRARRASPAAASSMESLGAAASAVSRGLDPALDRADRELLAAYRRLAEAADFAPPLAEAATRWQDALIERIIPRRATVLDLGCGTGVLLARLMRLKGVRGHGIELDPEAVMQCIERGVPVLQSNLDAGLKGFPDRHFDFVVLEETAQALHRPLAVLEEMLRVGRRGIVSFPNFGYWRVRLALALEGRMPITERLPYRWYDTPNIHLFTLQDFLDWIASRGVRTVKAYVLVNGKARPLREGDNLRAEEALFVVSKDGA